MVSVCCDYSGVLTVVVLHTPHEHETGMPITRHQRALRIVQLQACYATSNRPRVVFRAPRLSLIQRLTTLHNQSWQHSATFRKPRDSGCTGENSPWPERTLGRRDAAWFTRCTTDWSDFPTSDIATFHIVS